MEAADLGSGGAAREHTHDEDEHRPASVKGVGGKGEAGKGVDGEGVDGCGR